MSGTEYTAKVYDRVGAIDAAVWDGLATDTASAGNPFVSHAFLSSLEDSRSVGPGTGWQPAPIVIEDADDIPQAALPAYAKGHSQGEYVFDHAWADAFERAGGRYYPKLQIAAPFTPATGPRILARDPALTGPLLQAAEQLCVQNGFSSAHATFIEPDQTPFFERQGWLAAQGHPVPLDQSRVSRVRGFSRYARLAQAQEPAQGAGRGAGGRHHPAPARRADRPRALGRVLGVLPGYRVRENGALPI